jgi:hypothetical protein
LIAEREHTAEQRGDHGAGQDAEWRVDLVLSEHVEANLKREHEYWDYSAGGMELQTDAAKVRKAIGKHLIKELIGSKETDGEGLRRRIDRLASHAL